MSEHTFLVVVDGSNIVNDVGRYLKTIATSLGDDLQHKYFRDWFDIDRLVQATLNDPYAPATERVSINSIRDLGIVTFRSKQEVGDSVWAIKANELDTYWARQGSNPASSVMLVDILGAPKGKERALDMSMAVHLFETVDSWDAAVLFTNDSDFVPAVWSLRRKGKRVYCSSHVADDVSRPLVQACQHFFRWDVEFLQVDRAFFEFLQPNSALDAFLGRPDMKVLNPRVIVHAHELELRARTGGFRDDHDNVFNDALRGSFFHARKQSQDSMLVQLCRPNSDGKLIIVSREQVIEGVNRHYELLAPAAWTKML